MHILRVFVCDNRFWFWTDIFARKKKQNLGKNNEVQYNKMEVHNSHFIITWDHLDQWESG